MNNLPMKPEMKIFGHRGAAGLVFENTLASIQKAIELQVDFIEIDVWLTTDNEVVVFHDAYLDRLTSQTGFIAEKSWPELQHISLKNGDQIPSLRQVIDLVKPTKIPLVVEVKAEIAFEQTRKILAAELPFQSYIIGSFYHQTIMELKQQNPELQTAIMFEGVPANCAEYLARVAPDYIVISFETCNEFLRETVQDQGQKLVFYTVNTPAEIAMARRFNPFGIVTNYPDRFLPANPGSRSEP